MVNMLFFLKFKSQLRRTQPELVEKIDESLSRAVSSAEGKVTGERPCFHAVFDEDNFGFALDLFILIESLKKSLEASRELYGYALIISASAHKSPELLCRFLAGGEGGFFLDSEMTGRLAPYAVMETPADWLKGRGVQKYGADGFYRLKKLKPFTSSGKNNAGLPEDVGRLLIRGRRQNTLVLETPFTYAQRGLHRYCKKLNGDFPALTVRFGQGAISALVDTWSLSIRALSGDEAAVEEINMLWESLFQERIRDEVSAFNIRSARRFFSLILDFYIAAALNQKRFPILILENIHLAGKTETKLLLDLVTAKQVKSRNSLLILGSCLDSVETKKLKRWEKVFAIAVKTDGDRLKPFPFPELPIELWEITYAISLFGRYFSPGLFLRLFEEEGKNPVMIARAFSMLHILGVVNDPREPCPVSGQFAEQAEYVLGAKVGHIKAIIRRRLLSWVAQMKLNPCFHLLTIIAGLGGIEEIDDILILKSIISDLLHGTKSSAEYAVNSGMLKEIIGEKRAELIRYVFNTTKVLLSGDKQEIYDAFKEQPPDCESFPAIKGRILVNLCSYHSGMRDKAKAVDSAKEAILLGQNKNNICLPNAYRLISLVSLSKQQLSESIDYLGFALSSAETSGNDYEVGVSAYYAAVSQFLFGNVYKAALLTNKSMEHSLAANCPGWADRSRFLEGRIAFEIGRYQTAQKIFTVLRRYPFDRITEEKDSLLAAWIYRSKIYSQNPQAAKPESGGSDADLFEVEAAYLAGNYKKTADLASSLNNPFSKDNFIFIERPDWRSGFDQCEHLYFSQGEIWDRMICVFHSLALCRLSAKGGEEAMRNMQRILRNERLSEMDPWDAFYFYAWYRILERTGAEIVDMNTAVSMAFKRLQRRVSRIEDAETRHQYMNGPRWNRELSMAARDFKLI
jgi:tetratricopeptide (TPR) repeat protein